MILLAWLPSARPSLHAPLCTLDRVWKSPTPADAEKRFTMQINVYERPVPFAQTTQRANDSYVQVGDTQGGEVTCESLCLRWYP